MPFSVQDVLQWTQGRVANPESFGVRIQEVSVRRPSSLSGSRADELAFFFSKAFQHELPAASPGILITAEEIAPHLKAAKLPLWTSSVVITCSDPYLAMAVLSEKFAQQISTVAHLGSELLREDSVGGTSIAIHPTAVVAKTAELGVGVRIGAQCVIEEKVKIGAHSILYPGCYLGPQCTVGDHSVLFPGVRMYEWTQIGSRVRIHAGSVLGSDGFGYAPERSGNQVVGHQKIYHLGRVIVEDDVEIGANCCVDRGTFGETWVGAGAKIDNLVHLGHNSKVAEGAILCGGTCLAGNASVGRFAYIGGLTGVGNHVHIGDGAKVAALSMVTKDVAPGGTAVGNPQREHQEHFRAHALLSRLLAERRKK